MWRQSAQARGRVSFDGCRWPLLVALMNGQPCLRGLRLSVRRVVEIAASYPDSAERAVEYPELEDEDIRQALHFAAQYLIAG